MLWKNNESVINKRFKEKIIFWQKKRENNIYWPKKRIIFHVYQQCILSQISSAKKKILSQISKRHCIGLKIFKSILKYRFGYSKMGKV